MMRHYDNLGVGHALRNASILFSSMPIMLCTRTITYDFENDVFRQCWNDDKEHPPDRYGETESDIWGGKWEILVIFGEIDEKSRSKDGNYEIFTNSDEENEFLCVLSVLLRGYSIQDGENTYTWNHHDTTLQKNGRSEHLTFGEFMELAARLFMSYLRSVPEHQMDEMDRWNVK